jgi:hypothetical protein
MLVTMYFYVLFDATQLTEAQVATIRHFSLHAVAEVAERLPGLVASVIMGNPFIDADFEASSARFRDMLAATAPDRERRFGPAVTGAAQDAG